MNDDLISDLKQFIAATIQQQLAPVRDDMSSLRDDMIAMEKRLTNRMDDIEARLTHRIDELEENIGDALATSNDATDEQLKDHERRLVLLERHA